MDKNKKRIIAIISVVLLAMLSIFYGNLSTEKVSNDSLSEELNKLVFGEEKAIKYILQNGDSNNAIQKISINGEINSEMINSYSSSSVINQIKSAAKNDNVKAILLSVNTPGGGVYESSELYTELKNSKKDVYVSMKQIAASGGYYISMAAKKIFASEETTTGSIGVVMSNVSAQKFLNDHGIVRQKIASGNQKAVGGTFETLPEESVKIYQNQVNESYEKFVKIVSEGRKLPLDEVKKLADGRTYTGMQALNNKLIDKIASEDELIKEIIKEKNLSNVQVFEYVKQSVNSSLLSKIVPLFSKSLADELLKKEQDLTTFKKSYIVE